MFRKARENDLIGIMNVIKEAIEYLKEQGVDQWQDGYPNENNILADIKISESYVFELSGEIVATGYLSFEEEETYKIIDKGQWLSDEPYGVLHRTAVSKKARNTSIAKKFFEEFEQLVKDKNIKSIKIDTHGENIPMQKFLKKLGYIYCGIIYLEDGRERVAFEKIL